LEEGTCQKYRAPQLRVGPIPAQHQQRSVNALSRLNCWNLHFVNIDLTPSYSPFVERICVLVGKLELW